MSNLVVQLAAELPGWPRMLAANIIGRLKSESLQNVTSTVPEGAPTAAAAPDRFYCWSSKADALVSMPLAFAPDYTDWNEVWARGLDAAGCRT